MSYAASGYWAQGYAPGSSELGSTADVSAGVSVVGAAACAIQASDPVSAQGASSTSGAGAEIKASAAQVSAGSSTALATSSQIVSATPVEADAIPAQGASSCSAIALAIAGSQIVVANGTCTTVARAEAKEPSIWIPSTNNKTWAAQGSPEAFEWNPASTQNQVIWN
jgi:hypothetical protein